MEKTLKIAQYKKIGSLSLVKFLLAFVTFLFHWRMHFAVVYSYKILDKVVISGAFAMGGFFILSGFLLYYIYSKKDFSDFGIQPFFEPRCLLDFCGNAGIHSFRALGTPPQDPHSGFRPTRRRVDSFRQNH